MVKVLVNAQGKAYVDSNNQVLSQNIESLSVTPTTSSQTINAPSGVDGYSPINVSAVTSSIDANITAGNIRKNVQILGVTGTYEGTGYTDFPSYQVSNGAAIKRSGVLTGNEFNGITSIGSNVFYYLFYQCTGLTGSLNLSSLINVDTSGFYYAFNRCSGLTSVDLSSLTTVGTRAFFNAFYECTGLTGSLNLSSLTTINDSGLYYAFYKCSGLTSVDLSSLTTVDDSGLESTFAGCKNITDIYFNSLTTTSFGSYTNQFSNMMNNTGTTQIHTLHFPSNLQSTISGLKGYPLFGGSSGYVVLSFDLPATS
jgi:hypothetical protein